MEACMDCGSDLEPSEGWTHLGEPVCPPCGESYARDEGLWRLMLALKAMPIGIRCYVTDEDDGEP